MEHKKHKYTLKPHQQRVLDKLDNPDVSGLLVYHGLGSGKTLTSIAAADEMGVPTDVITPAALRDNYLKEIIKHTGDSMDNVSVRSYNAAVANPEAVPADLRIIDEAHNLGRSDSKRSKLFDKLPDAKKTLLLTGTPIRNDPSELAPLINALYNDGDVVPRSKDQFNNQFIAESRVVPSFFDRMWYGVKPGMKTWIKNKQELKDLLKGRVDYYDNGSSTDYPTVTEKTIEVPMTDKQHEIYDMVTSNAPASLLRKIELGLPPSKSELKSLNAFMSAARQASDNPSIYDAGGVGTTPEDSSKIMAAANNFLSRSKTDPTLKEIVYSSYIDAALKPYAAQLDAAKTPYAFITGDIPFETRRQSVEDYNAGKLKALLLSTAGSEGLDLKGTNLVQLLEPHWHEERLNQAVGRAARYKSHSNLPLDKQKVEVEKYIATLPPSLFEKAFGMEPKRSSDQYLELMSQRKKELNQMFLNILKEVGNEPAET